ncbi:Fc.00g100740.m01.CDS01 [Cosmosporella sp. VM-42]
MDNYLAAIGREFGKVDTDSGGLARYSLKLQVPPGIGGNEPELSLQYAQGLPNGSLGLGWALGGLSCIRKGSSSLAYDGNNMPPPDFDRSQPKLNLDGAELLSIKGNYFEQGAEYTTEIDSTGTVVSHLDAGFMVCDSNGIRKEYGTTDDSRVLISDGNEIREWRLKKQVDRHGNSITFFYTASPQGTSPSVNVGTCYLSEVRYGSNETTGHPATRSVRLEYAPREDLIVQTIQGDKAIWGSLLTAIHTGVIRGDAVRVGRSYELAYTRSKFTRDSCLTSVTETAGNGARRVELLPSKFGYTSPEVSGELFQQQKVTNLRMTTNNVALFTLNISGRSLADVACVRYNPASKSMSIKTYLANKESDGSVTWSASDGPGAEAALPAIDPSRGFPNILAPDVSGDGRSDLIVPYADSDGMVRFSLSQSLGTGFQTYRSKSTQYKWTDGSKFMAVDLTGRGSVDVVQIFTDEQRIAFRNFPSLVQNGEIGLKDAKLTRTSYENVGTIDWFTLTHAKTSAMSLVRVWVKDMGKGVSRIMATSFISASSSNSSSGFREGKTSILEASVKVNQTKYNVVACDINGDGTQDIVLATAEYRNSRMVLAYTTFLGDGQGGFDKHESTITREIATIAPLNPEPFGQFHTTNLNGSNYPSVSYIYQERNSKSYLCLSVDGLCDGRVSEVTSYRVAKDMPSLKMEVVPTDLNGTGMGSWLFHTIENDQPRLVPVINRAEVTDYLSWAQDPMGLRTDLTYGPLSDQDVYKTSVSWKNYINDSKDSYVVLGAPNYVVKGLKHSNDKSINSFDYKVSIKKSYSSAVINTKGRGWQGFGEVHSLNTTDGILTTEKYFQTWPLTSQKSQIDTKTSDGKVLRSEKTSFESISTSKGPWKIFHVNRTLEQTDMLEDGVVARSNANLYTYDEDGNVTSHYSSEHVRGKLAFQSWQRNTYTAINAIKGLLTSKKLSSKQENTNMSVFENGDSSLNILKYDPTRATLVSISEWSTDVAAFAVKSFAFDKHGNEIQTVDAAGLKTTTEYDGLFKSFPVKVTSEGPGISMTQLAAFDEASGQKAAQLDISGSLSCYRVDGFGRTVETRTRSADRGSAAVAANDFFINQPYVAETSFSAILAGSSLDPYRELRYERQKDSSGSTYVGAKLLTSSKGGVDGQVELFELMDCAGQVRKRYSQHADSSERTWMFWEYDSGGHQTFETFPIKAPASSGLDWAPDLPSGVSSSFDTLGRPTLQVRPAHVNKSHFVVSSMQYCDGGARVQERTLRASDPKKPLENNTELAFVEKINVHIGQENLITEVTDENGLRSTFQYDVAGNMILATDPAGNEERRTYNSKGLLVTINDPYQNVGLVAKSSTTYKYNLANYLESQTNAAGEVVTYKRDAKGRPLQKVGHDGRTLVYAYGAKGTDKPSSLIIYPKGESSSFESQFHFTYDHNGRLKDRTLVIADGSRFTTSTSYDWHGEAIRKVFPDGAILTSEYRGGLLKSSTLESGSNSNWSLKADVAQYSAAESPEKIVVQGSGMEESFEHEWQYDAQGFPVSHGLRSGKSDLVQDHYMYNDTDQMVRKHEFLSGITTDYSYLGRRLISSQLGDGVKNSYEYDRAGNLINKRGVSITHSPGRSVGIRGNASVFDVSYDSAGRMIKRTTDQSSFDFAYDSFGVLKSFVDKASGASLEIIADFEGETLQQKHSDGSLELTVGHDYSVHIQPDGSRVIKHKLFGRDYLLGSVSNTFESASSTRPLGGGNRVMRVAFTDVKGNVTHLFNGDDASLREKLDYDDYGSLESTTPGGSEKDRSSTYEGRRLDEATGLLDFGGRWYDPLIGRFTTPDDISDVDLLIRTDGLNRYAFENNDPINHVDPTGHWSWFSGLGLALGAIMIIGAAALTVVTGGAAGILMAAAVGALVGGGIAGITYSIEHHDEENAGKFFGGFATTVGINAAIGAAAGFLGAVATPAKALSGASQIFTKSGLLSIGAKALIGGTASVLKTATERGVSNIFYGTNQGLFDGALSSFATGALVGAALGAWQLRGTPSAPAKIIPAFKLTVGAVLAPNPTSPWARVGITVAALVMKETVMKSAGGLGSYGYKKTGLDKEVNR